MFVAFIITIFDLCTNFFSSSVSLGVGAVRCSLRLRRTGGSLLRQLYLMFSLYHLINAKAQAAVKAGEIFFQFMGAYL